ncbi:hypothetical protein OROMI_003736 [Orobanche minor]
MEPKIFPLDAITPETKNWTAKVSIVNKTEPRTSSQPASIRFQKLLLADNRENTVEAMLYRGDIELLKNSLRIDQTYLISNAVVRPVKPGFENPLTNNKYQWILGARTSILATDADAIVLSKLAPTFTQSDHFRDFLGKRTLISAAAIIIDSHLPRTVMAKGKENTLHEYAAIDELLNPFIITFWNDVAPDDVYNLLSSTKERHIITALNFSVSDYHNVSLSSTSASVVLIKSNIERLQALQKWGFVYTKRVLTYSNSRVMFSGKHKPTSAMIHKFFHQLKHCLRPNKFRFSLLIYDDSGEIEVTVFGDEGEKLMQMSANDFITQYCNNEPLILDSINSNLRQMKLKMKIQSKVFNKQDASPTGLTNVLELSVPHKIETTFIPSTTKEHPRPDIHPNTSSRDRASKAKKTE